MQPGQNKNNPGENNDERRKNEGNFHERRINQNNGFSKHLVKFEILHLFSQA